MATLAAAPSLPLELLNVGDPHQWVDYTVLPKFAELRRHGPLHWCPDSIYGPYWSVVSHQHIQEVEGQPDIFSSAFERGGITIADRPDDREEPPLPMFIAMDRPQHTGQRRTVAPAFTPAEMERQKADIRRRTAELLDRLPEGERFDWVDRVSIELTTGMLAILFDFPWEDRRLLTKWSDAAVDFESIEDPEKNAVRWNQLFEMGAYFTNLWNERANAEPRPDLISRMIHSEATRNMSPMEYMGNLVLLIVGGNDTTRNTMSGSAMVQQLFPAEWARVMADPGLTANAASELIRWQTPLAHMRRTATRDQAVAGETIRAGEKVVLWYLSANRDERVFADADRFDPTRENARRHLSFGFGIHRCVGARLAELQISILIDEMRARRMAVEVVGKPVRVYSSFVHGYRELPVVIRRG
jgi:cytochrome P450